MNWRWNYPIVSAAALCLALGLAAPFLAADTKKEPDKRTEIKSKAEKTPSVAAVDFAAVLGIDLQNLKTLGTRIDQARSSTDPVALALTAKELAVAEEVSQKKADPTAAALTEEAVKMVRARNRPAELKALASLVEKEREPLRAQAEKAEKQIQARIDSPGSKGIQEYLIVVNKTPYYVDIRVNYLYEGTIEPGATRKVWVGDGPDDTTVIAGRSAGGSWGPRYVPGAWRNYTWILTP